MKNVAFIIIMIILAAIAVTVVYIAVQEFWPAPAQPMQTEIYSVDMRVNANEQPGADIGEKIDVALSKLPRWGGIVTIDSGTYDIKTPVRFVPGAKIVGRNVYLK